MTTLEDCKYKYQKLDFIKHKCATDPRWALRALERIYADQTRAEQAAGHTSEHNGVGFSGVDGDILSSFAEQFARRRSLSPKQMEILFKKMPKYARQLLNAVEDKGEEPKTMAPSVNPTRHLRNMHRSDCE